MTIRLELAPLLLLPFAAACRSAPHATDPRTDGDAAAPPPVTCVMLATVHDVPGDAREVRLIVPIPAALEERGLANARAACLAGNAACEVALERISPDEADACLYRSPELEIGWSRRDAGRVLIVESGARPLELELRFDLIALDPALTAPTALELEALAPVPTAEVDGRPWSAVSRRVRRLR